MLTLPALEIGMLALLFVFMTIITHLQKAKSSIINILILILFDHRDRPKSKQFPEIRVSKRIEKIFLKHIFKALGDDAFSFQFEDSSLLEGLIAGETRVGK